MTVIGSQATSNNSKNYMSTILDEGTLCSICADPIHDYIPKFFEDIQINPACTNCDDETESNIDDQTATVNQDRTSPSCSLTLLRLCLPRVVHQLRLYQQQGPNQLKLHHQH